jgi:Fic family protein
MDILKNQKIMRITDKTYFNDYQNQLGFDLESMFNSMDFDSKKVDLGYRIQASAVFSLNIEGNSIDLNSFMNIKLSNQIFKPKKEVQEIDDLITAYEFAKANELNEENLLKVHEIIAQTLLPEYRQGVYRNDRMGVFDENGLVYLAIEAELVANKMQELFADIQILLKQDLTLSELFYHASLLHLKFVHIHPFWDRNGRTARLLEKWFLAMKINSQAWKIQSEKYYKENLKAYYNNINLGVNYYELKYEGCLDFLVMLGKSLV